MRKKIIVTVAILLLSVTCLYQGQPIEVLLAQPEQLYDRIKIFTSILETIQRVYVDEISSETLIDNAIRGVISNLDPHTVYLPAEDFRRWNQSFEGYAGIGISIDIVNDEVTVMNVISGGPGHKKGLLAGDKIVSVNGKSLAGLKRERIRQQLIGPPGTAVRIEVRRGGWHAAKVFNLVRDRIKLKSVTQVAMIGEKTGYIKLESFTAKTGDELEDALHELKSQHMQNLILDLRGNGGGYLSAAIEVADKFIPGGYTLLTTKGRTSNSYNEYYSTDHTMHPLYPLVVLIDHGSASAAEIVAGAVQDLDRGLIVGKSSFGKGLVQSQYRFYDGSALLITTAKYYTPSGRPIQRNYFAKTKQEYYHEAYDDSELAVGSDTQDRRFYTRSGRIVRGEGGITPDIWVTSDSNVLSPQLRELFFSDQRYFYSFAEKIIRQNPGRFKGQKNFIENYAVSEQLFREFITFIRSHDTDIKYSKMEADKKDIKFLLKREIAYLNWGEGARFKINLKRDLELMQALACTAKAQQLLSDSKLQKKVLKKD